MKRFPLLALLATCALGLAACGSGSTTTASTSGSAMASGSAMTSESAMTSGSAMTSESAMGSASAMTSGSAMASAAAMHPAFCTGARALGSLTKGTGSAMAMSPAEAATDFKVLAAKVSALKADAPTPALKTDVDTIVTKLGLDETVQRAKAAGTSGDAAAKLAAAAPGAAAATDRLVTAVKETCGVDAR